VSTRMEKTPRKSKDRPLTQPAASPAVPPVLWYQQPIWLALAGSLLLWASFPPLNLWPIAWVAPLPWLALVRQEKLRGWKPYLQIWLAGFVHWLLMLQGIRLAHPALYGGWLALSAYVAAYLVLFFAISRVAVHQLRWPLLVAAPVVWVGIELWRGHMISGFSSGMLAHTQTSWLMLLQIADLGGAYAVSFVMMLVAAVVVQELPGRWFSANPENAPTNPWSHRILPIATAVGAVVLTLAYGWYRLQDPPAKDNRPPLQVALIQGSLDTRFDQPQEERVRETFGHYVPLTRQAVSAAQELDLVIWPESMFTLFEFRSLDDGESTTAAKVPREYRERLAELQKPFQHTLDDALLAMPGASFLFGTITLEYNLTKPQQFPDRNYNSALLANPDGQIVGRYYKMHAVMFGEYIPCADWFPILQRITPLGPGMSVGDRPTLMQVKEYALAPNICFESTVPHLVRQQVIDLQRTKPVDVIVNVTNDGWFKGSSILDLHFRGNIFRAIENRKPMVVAANTGISAHIDGNGRVLQRGPKRAPQPLLVRVSPDGRRSPYHWIGDYPAWLCAWLTWGLAIYGVWRR
jgi:apolipoprotein N-acyltransferase